MPGEVMSHLDVVGLGEVCIDWITYVDRFPEIDEKIFVRDYRMFVGGVTANFMVAFARLGGRGGFIGGIGKDSYGRLIIEKLREEGVDVSHVKIWDGARSAFNIVVVDSHGRKYIYQDPRLMLNVPDPEDLREEYISTSRHVHTTAIKLETAKRLFEMAHERGITTSLDLEKHVADYGLEKLKEILRMTDVLMPNKLGIKALTGEEDYARAARRMLKYGPEVVVITLGEEGSIAVTENRVIRTPAFKVNAVDTTGAGDAFNAAFIYGLIVEEWDLERIALFANAVAAIKCTRPGAQSSPRMAEVSDFLKNRGIL